MNIFFIDVTNIDEFLKNSLIKKAPQKSDGKVFILEVEYDLTTSFSKLSPRCKKKAEQLRIKIFDEEKLFAISQDELHGHVSFKFCQGEKSDIEFSMPRLRGGKKLTWKISKDEIIPEESLAPWHYQKKHIQLRSKTKTSLPLSEYIDFKESGNFIVDELQSFLKERCDSKNLNSFTFKNLYEFGFNINRDFSDFIEKKKAEYYDSYVEAITYYYRVISDKILNVKAYNSWKELKKMCDEAYGGLKYILSGESPISVEQEKKLKEHLKKIDTELNDDFSNFSACYKPNAMELFQDENIKPLPKNIEEHISMEKAKGPKNDLIRDIEKVLPFLEQETSLMELLCSCKFLLSKGCAVPGREDKYIIPASINSHYNLLNPATCESRENKEYKWYTSLGDIVIATANYSFGEIAIVDESNVGRPLGKGVMIIGNVANFIDFWNLFRSEYIQDQISVYADFNIKKICYQNIFENIYVDEQKHRVYPNINRLTFEVANLLISEFYLDEVFFSYVGQSFKDISRKNLSHAGLDYYKLNYRIEMLLRSFTLTRKCLIIHDNEKQELAKTIKFPMIGPKLCNISNEGYNHIFKKIANYDACVVVLSFNAINKIEFIRNVLKIVGNNHIFIQEEESSKESRIVSGELFSWFEKVNSYTVKARTSQYELQDTLMKLADKNTKKAFVDFLICLSSLSPKSFKRIKCRASNSRKIYSPKEFAVFECLQKDLIHKAYNLKPSLPFNPILLTLFELNTKLDLCSSANKAFKEIKQKYGNKIINSGGIKTFVESHKQIVKDYKEGMPNLYQILQKTIKKFDADRRVASKKKLEQAIAINKERVEELCRLRKRGVIH